MNIPEYIEYHLPEILEIARLAPSVHNTQPWSVETRDNQIQINLDPDYVLADGDPTGRQTMISLGIFAEAVVIAAEHVGLHVKGVELQGKSAILTCSSIHQPGTELKEVTLLENRCSDRSVYQPAQVEAQAIHTIMKAKHSKHVSISVVTEEEILKIVAELTAKGIRLALSSPAFRKELSSYLVLPWSRKKRGIAVRSLYIPWFLEMIEPLLIRSGVGLNAESKLEKERWLSASAVVFITSKGDMPDYWFEVGRAYLQVSLAIEDLGFSQATSASLVEASNYHEDIEQLLGTTDRIQSVLRIGKGQKKREHSPRVTAKELIAT